MLLKAKCVEYGSGVSVLCYLVKKQILMEF